MIKPVFVAWAILAAVAVAYAYGNAPPAPSAKNAGAYYPDKMFGSYYPDNRTPPPATRRP